MLCRLIIFNALIIFFLSLLISCKVKPHSIEVQTSKKVENNDDKQNLHVNTSEIADIEKDEKKRIKKLIYDLGSPDKMVASNAIIELRKIGRTVVPELLIALTNENNFLQRIRTANALGMFRDSRAIKPLIEALSDECDEVKEASMMSFSIMLSNPELIEDVKTAVPAVINALNDDNYLVRLTAVGTLREIGDERAIKPLEKLIINEPEVCVKESALNALKVLRESKQNKQK
ncbi:MAG: HEAT repeat domain-containing protein [Planctomycetes bacterium]|nr:HEAT repeat domain-containing protein [Planctomycetota bacterium]